MAHNYDPLKPVMVRLSAADREALRKIARRRRCPEAAVMRDAISTYIRQQAEADSRPQTPFANDDQAREYAGQWVALAGKQVIAHGEDGVAVFHEARSQGCAVPRMIRVPRVSHDDAVFGL